MKLCRKCGNTKSLAEFYRRADRGERSVIWICKQCSRDARAKARSAQTPEQAEKSLAKARQWKRDNRERHVAGKRAWEAANPELHRIGLIRRASKWRSSNRETANARVLASVAKKPDHYRAQTAAWAKANPHLCRAKYKRYMTAKVNAVPAWINDFFVEEAYELAQHRQLVCALGLDNWHVDHIVPLQGAMVCGLHVHDNLQVIPGLLNISKGNRHWPNMWEVSS
jgi:hypothetical protein